MMAQRKIFAVGFNKSGTVSLHNLFTSLGYRSFHGEEWRTCNDLALLDAYDCFSDDIPEDLPKLDRLYPGSRFILQVRDLEGWVLSRLAHIQRAKDGGRYRGGREWDCTGHAVKAWIRARNEWHLYVLTYFAQRRQDLLVVNFIRDDMAATRVANFLGHPGTFPRPRENSNPRKGRAAQHVELLRSCVADLGMPGEELRADLLCPSQLDTETRRAFPADTADLKW